MEYIFELGSFPKLSLTEIFTVLTSENFTFHIADISAHELDIYISGINPEVFIKILGGTRSIFAVEEGKKYKQHIGAYKRREFHKPHVDPKSGLLPAKLAKMLINFSFSTNGVHHIYDPFCGGGTIITEANVMGIRGTGSDIAGKTVHAAKENALWIRNEYKLPQGMFDFFTSSVNDIPVEKLQDVDAIVTEPYMGKGVSRPLAMGRTDKENLAEVDKVIRKALIKASAILPAGKRMVIIIPQYKTTKGIIHLKISTEYSRYSFRRIHILKELDIDKSDNLLYFRPKAVVLRDIFILEKI